MTTGPRTEAVRIFRDKFFEISLTRYLHRLVDHFCCLARKYINNKIFSRILISKIDIEMNFRIIAKNYAADSN